jgi:hypothetical protein
LHEIISLQNTSMSKKRTFTYIFTLFVDFLSTPAFLVPTPVPCSQIAGVNNHSQIAYKHVIDWYYCAVTLLYIDRMLVFDFGNSVGNPT